jgi:hypothetical protein
MTLGRSSLAAAAAIGALIAVGCGNGNGGSGTGSTSTAGTGGTTTTSSTTIATVGTGGAVGSGGGGGAGGSGPTFEPSGFSCTGKKPSLNADVVPITSPNCGTMAACHLAMVSGSGVYDQLVNRPAEECNDPRLMINPSDPEHSYVINKLTGHNLCSPPTTMPLDSAQLPAADIQTIYDWICEGAPEN